MTLGAILPKQRRDLRGDWRDGSAPGTCLVIGDVDHCQRSQQQCDTFVRVFHSVLSLIGFLFTPLSSPVLQRLGAHVAVSTLRFCRKPIRAINIKIRLPDLFGAIWFELLLTQLRAKTVPFCTLMLPRSTRCGSSTMSPVRPGC